MGCTELVWHKIAHSNHKSYFCWNHHLLVHFPLRPISTKGNFVLLSLSATLISNFNKITLMRYLKSHIRFKWVWRYFSSRSGHAPLKIEWSSTFKPSLFPLISKVQSSKSSAMSWQILSFAVSATCPLILVRSGSWLCAVGTPLSLATACLICKGTRACQCRVLCEATIILGQFHLSLEYDAQPFPFSTLLDFSRLRLIAVFGDWWFDESPLCFRYIHVSSYSKHGF